jgi:hypothetical protein
MTDQDRHQLICNRRMAIRPLEVSNQEIEDHE